MHFLWITFGVLCALFTEISTATKYEIRVRTGDDPCDCKVGIQIIGRNGKVFSHDDLDTKRDDREKWNTDTYVYDGIDVGIIDKIKIIRTDNDGWKLEDVSITKYNSGGSDHYEFPCSHHFRTSEVMECLARCRCNGIDGDRGCQYHGKCEPYGRCVCNKGYYGHNCDACPSIEYCDQEVCSSRHDVICEKCHGESSKSTYSLYWPINNRKTCTATCSYNHHWCWPGMCSKTNYASSCTCKRGFRLKRGKEFTKCDLTEAPDIDTCRLIIKDEHGTQATTTSGSRSKSCQFETDTYTNLIPRSLQFHIVASFDKNKTDMTNPPFYIDKDETSAGIVSGDVEVYKLDIKERKTALQKVSLKGSGDCTKQISDTKTVNLLDCSRTLSIADKMASGEKLCVDLQSEAGGFYKYMDFNNKTIGTQTFSRQKTVKTLCFRYDNILPEHCSENTHCNSTPLMLSTRLSHSGSVEVSVSGWIDPHPNLSSDSSSGITKYLVQVVPVKVVRTLMRVTYPATAHYNTSGSHIQHMFQLPTSPGLYCVMLEVHDKAGNVRYARRFVLYDNTSHIVINYAAPLRVTSASAVMNYRWQTHTGPVCINWKGRYYNSYYILNNLLKPIKRDDGGQITGIYEQTTGFLPVAGTDNVDGITNVMYIWTLNNGSSIKPKTVPNLLNESMCLQLQVSDGQIYHFDFFISDIAKHQVTEAVKVHIDSSVPYVGNMWLHKGDEERIYVHDSTDLSTMDLRFNAYDLHSGIRTVQWLLGLRISPRSTIGQGYLKVKSVEKCSNNSLCYCPAVGLCEYFSYRIDLNKLILNNTQQGQHNREYYFTFVVTNGAGLKTIEHLDILVDGSPPEVGVVQEGTADEPDIDYTSDSSVLINWHGFIDHESGIHHYLIGFGPRCLTPKELMFPKESNTSVIVKTMIDEVRITFPSSGLLYSSVIAINNALEPSRVACSDGIVHDTTPPFVHSVSLDSAVTSPRIVCIDGNPWYLMSNISMQAIKNTNVCSNVCRKQQFQCDFPNVTKLDRIINDMNVANSVCAKTLLYDCDTVWYLPSDRIVLNWNIYEPDSQIRSAFVGLGSDRSGVFAPDIMDYRQTNGINTFALHHSAVGNRAMFYIFIKVINKANLQTREVLGPVMIDDTPPLFSGVLTAKVEEKHVLVTWENKIFSDPEDTSGNFKVLYRIGFEEGYVTPFLETSKRIRNVCAKNGHAGCIQYPLKQLQLHDSELGRHFFFELYVYNKAGHFTTVQTQPFQIPSRFPPAAGLVFDTAPYTTVDSKDVDFHGSPHIACAEWSGFGHHSNVSFQIGIGYQPGSDDIIGFQPVPDSTRSSMCVKSKKLQPFTQYYATIIVRGSGGTSKASSDGFMIIDNNTPSGLNVYDGNGCYNDTKKLFVKLISQNKTTLEYASQGSFNVGLFYSASTSYTIKHVTSTDIIVFKRTISSFSFIPLSRSFHFEIQVDGIINDTTQDVKFQQCINDTEYQYERSIFNIHWVINSHISQYVTHFVVTLLNDKCEDNDISGNCSYPVASEVVSKEFNSFQFGNLNLGDGYYRGSVSACFETLCLNKTVSSGARVMTTKPLLELNKAVLTSTVKHNKLEVSFKVDATESIKIYIAQVRLMRSTNQGWRPILPWQQLASLSRHDNLTFNGMVDIIQSIKGDVAACVLVFSNMGLIEERCTHVDNSGYRTDDHYRMLFETVAGEDDIELIKPLLKSTSLGGHINKLHALDVDVVQSSARLVGLITNSEGRNISWYLMSNKHFPPGKCADDPDCVQSLQTYGGIAEFKHTHLKEGNKYIICAKGKEASIAREVMTEILDEFEVCGNGFVIDNTPPIAGTVIIKHLRNGFISDVSSVALVWNEFKDIDVYLEDIHLSGVMNYSYCIGSHKYGQDIVPLTYTGTHTHASVQGVVLRPGISYFATVKGIDHVGQESAAVSDVFMVDNSPPLAGSVYIEGLLADKYYVSARTISVHWRGFDDHESGVEEVWVAVGSHPDTTDILPFRKCDHHFAEIEATNKFIDGHYYFIQLQVINRAGLVRRASSSAFVIDRSPPETGTVRDGSHLQKEELDYQQDSTTIHSHWFGFSDPNSQIKYYRVGLGTKLFSADVYPSTNVGRIQNMTWTGNFVPGIKYYTSVEACNYAELCSSAVSDGVTIDKSPPIAGHVQVGLNDEHQKYVGHKNVLTGHWVGFVDPESGMQHFTWCVGRRPGACNVVKITAAQLSDSFIKTGLNLPLSTTLYLTVWGLNNAGMQSNSTSHGFTVDITNPRIMEPPIFVNIGHQSNTQFDPSVLKLKWHFLDYESPIQRQIITLNTHRESKSAVELIESGNFQERIIIFDKQNRLRNGDHYTATITACNVAGLCSSSSSKNILIDSTAPHMGGFKNPMTWRSLNKNGRMFIELNITWYGFVDPESGLDRYELIIGKTYHGHEISGGVIKIKHEQNVTEQNYSFLTDQKLVPGDSLILKISVINNVGLVSKFAKSTLILMGAGQNNTIGILDIQRHSCRTHYCTDDCTCSIIGKRCQNDYAPRTCNKNSSNHHSYPDVVIHLLKMTQAAIPISKSPACISAYWNLTNPQYLQVFRFEWSLGSRSRVPGSWFFDSISNNIWHDVNLQQTFTFCLQHNFTLIKEQDYFVFVRVWYTEETYKIFESSPFRVDTTPPKIRRGKIIMQSDRSYTSNREVFSMDDNIHVCWGNVFQERPGGLDHFDVWLGTSPGGDDTMHMTDVGVRTNISVLQANVRHGIKYYATVRAVNDVGLYTLATSNGFLIDDTPPIPGVVYNMASFTDTNYQYSSTLSISWHGFVDKHSAITNFEVAIGLMNMPINESQFKSVGIINRYVFKDYTLEHGKTYRGIVRARDMAAWVSPSVQSESVTIDKTAPIGFKCSHFETVPNVTFISLDKNTGPKLFQEITANITVEKNYYYRVKVDVDHISEIDETVILKIGDVIFTLQFVENADGSGYGEHTYLASNKGNILMSISIPNSKRSENNIHAIFEVCTDIDENTEAISLAQVTPSVLSVCSRVLDAESGIRSFLIAVGSTEGGFQIEPLKHVVPTTHHLVDVDIPHGNPVYVTIIATNQAGLSSYFISRPLVIDASAPNITSINANIQYGNKSQRTVAVVTTFDATDLESNVSYCLCALGKESYSTDLSKWIVAENKLKCEFMVSNTTHGIQLFVTIKCVNKVKLSSYKIAGPLTVIWSPPSLEETKIAFLSGNNVIATKEVTFSWIVVHRTDGFEMFQYRLVAPSGIRSRWYNTSYNYATMDWPLMEDGKWYEVQVQARNYRQLVSKPVSASFKYDSRIPQLTGHAADLYILEGMLHLDWKGVFTSYQLNQSFTVSLGSQEGYTDIIHQQTTENSHLVSPVDASSTNGLHVTVKATLENHASVVYSEFVKCN